ncbi:MAG: rod shape-determining protein [bacterium]
MFNRLSQDVGIDLGTANTLVYVRNKGIIINEPSVVAINTRTDTILAVGTEAKKMLGKTPPHLVVTRPLMDGIISNFEVTERMLKFFFDKIYHQTLLKPRPRVVIGIPLEVTEVERKAVEDAALSAGAKEVYLVEETVAAAIGSRLPITEAAGTMVIDIGGGTTDIAVISLGGVVAWKSLKLAGDKMTEAIISYVRDTMGLLIGDQQAEEVKMRIGSALPLDDDMIVEIRGRDALSGLPKEVKISDSQIREAISKSIQKIVSAVKETLEHTPPELMPDIYERGIVLSGGGALLKNLDKAISQAATIPVHIADDPLTAVVRGAGLLLEDADLLSLVTLPSTHS